MTTCGRFRIAFLVERLSPPANGLTGAFDATYLSGLTTVSYLLGHFSCTGILIALYLPDRELYHWEGWIRYNRS